MRLQAHVRPARGPGHHGAAFDLLHFVAGWRNYLVEDMHDIHVLARPFDGPRNGFNRDDPSFRQIYCSVGGDLGATIPEATA